MTKSNISNTMSIIKMVEEFIHRRGLGWNYWFTSEQIIRTFDPDEKLPINSKGKDLLTLLIQKNGGCVADVDYFIRDVMSGVMVMPDEKPMAATYGIIKGFEFESVNHHIHALKYQSFDERDKMLQLAEAMSIWFFEKPISITSILPAEHRRITMRNAILFYLIQVEKLNTSEIREAVSYLKNLSADLEEPFKCVKHWIIETNRYLVGRGHRLEDSNGEYVSKALKKCGDVIFSIKEHTTKMKELEFA